MLRAQITPLTLYNIDNTIFDGIELPKRPFTDRGYQDLFLTGWDMDKPTFINNLLLETAELNVLYTNPDFFKFAVTQWAAKEKAVWQSLYETIFFKYNPIWNKDGTVKTTAKEERDLINQHTNNSEDDNLTVTRGDNTINGTIHENTHSFEQIDGEQEKTGEDTTTLEHDTTETLTDTYDSTETLTIDYNSKLEKTNDNTTTGNKRTETDETETPRETITTENQVAAFDSTVYVNHDKTVETHSGNNTTETDVVETYNNLKISDDGAEEHTGQDTHTTEHDGTDTHTTEHDGTDTTTITYNNKITHGEDDTTDVDMWKTNNERTDINNRIETKNKTHGGLKIEDRGEIDNTNTTIEQGNIGITTQQMIEAERELVKFNIYDVIIESFKQRFCLLIY